MNDFSLEHFEQLCRTLSQPSNQQSFVEADKALQSLTANPDYFPQLQFVLENSSDENALFIACTSIKQLFQDHWRKIPSDSRLSLKKYLLNYLASRGPSSKRPVQNAMIALLTRVVKICWFDDPEHQTIAYDL